MSRYSIPDPSDNGNTPGREPAQEVFDPSVESPFFPAPEPAVQVGDDLVLLTDLPSPREATLASYHRGYFGEAHLPDWEGGAL
jgi:hypothetical protein